MFKVLFYQPTLNGLLWLYDVIPGQDFGIAIIVLTVGIRVLLIPLAKKGIRSQRALTRIQPKVKKIREKYKDDPQQMTKKTMGLYKEEGISPFSGFVPLLVQLPIIFALLRVINTVFPRGEAAIDMVGIQADLYSFVAYPIEFQTQALGGLIDNLAATSLVLAVLAGLAQFVQSRLVFAKSKESDKGKKSDFQAAMQTQMKYIFPVLTVFIAASLPAAFALYWFTATVFAAAQQWLMLRAEPEPS